MTPFPLIFFLPLSCLLSYPQSLKKQSLSPFFFFLVTYLLVAWYYMTVIIFIIIIGFLLATTLTWSNFPLWLWAKKEKEKKKEKAIMYPNDSHYVIFWEQLSRSKEIIDITNHTTRELEFVRDLELSRNSLAEIPWGCVWENDEEEREGGKC